jgi:hypothetical protein
VGGGAYIADLNAADLASPGVLPNVLRPVKRLEDIAGFIQGYRPHSGVGDGPLRSDKQSCRKRPLNFLDLDRERWRCDAQRLGRPRESNFSPSITKYRRGRSSVQASSEELVAD